MYILAFAIYIIFKKEFRKVYLKMSSISEKNSSYLTAEERDGELTYK